MLLTTEQDVLCSVCREPINRRENHDLIWDMHSDMLDIVDFGGVEALTGPEQVLYHELIHAECFECLQCTYWQEGDKSNCNNCSERRC